MIKKLQCSGGMWKFAEKAAMTWGLKPWKGTKDPDEVLFFGMYSDNDYDIFRHFNGKKSVFWCGSDIIQMLQDPERRRIIKLFPDVQHYTETEQEKKELESMGLEVYASPSFLDSVKNFPVSYKPSKTPHIYLSGHINREEEYGFGLCKEIAEEHPEFIFHFYGVEGENTKNVIYHGWVEEEQFNEEIRNYQCGLRCNAHDGASELIFKSALMGQYPISFLPYEKVWQFKTKEELVELLNRLKKQDKPNLEAREYWLPRFNSYPWMEMEENWEERNEDDFNIDIPHRKLLLDKIKELKPESILEVGCGAGSNLALIQKEFPNVKIAGLDINRFAIANAVKHLGNIQLVVGDAGNLPFEDKSFDMVITDVTLIYIPPEKIEKVKSELLRVAKRSILMVEFHREDFDKLGRIAFRHWTRDYKKLFEGYKVETYKITDTDSFKWDTIGYIITVYV